MRRVCMFANKRKDTFHRLCVHRFWNYRLRIHRKLCWGRNFCSIFYDGVTDNEKHRFLHT